MSLLSDIDGFTGVATRKAFVKNVCHHAVNNNLVYVAYFDIRYFMCFNDIFGHREGDKALKDIAAIIVNVFGFDNVFRVAGDDFCCIYQHHDQKELKRKIRNVNHKVKEKFHSFHMDEHNHLHPFKNDPFTLETIGTFLKADFQDETEFDEWFTALDKKLYRLRRLKTLLDRQ